METFKKALRWVLCIPLGVIGGTCAQLVAELLLVYTNRYVEAGSFISTIPMLLAGGIGGAAAVYVAAYVAPSHRLGVAIFLLMVSISSVYFGFMNAQIDGDWGNLLLTSAQTAGGAWVVYLIFKKRITFNEVFGS